MAPFGGWWSGARRWQDGHWTKMGYWPRRGMPQIEGIRGHIKIRGTEGGWARQQIAFRGCWSGVLPEVPRPEGTKSSLSHANPPFFLILPLDALYLRGLCENFIKVIRLLLIPSRPAREAVGWTGLDLLAGHPLLFGDASTFARRILRRARGPGQSDARRSRALHCCSKWLARLASM